MDEFGTRGAVNIKSIEAKGKLIKKALVTNIIVDCLGICKVPVLSLLKSFNLEKETALINGLTGLDFSNTDLFEVGLKIANLEKHFNLRHETKEIKESKDLKDTLPEMFFRPDKDHGLTHEKFNTMLQEFYHAMGWDENGIPEPIKKGRKK